MKPTLGVGAGGTAREPSVDPLAGGPTCARRPHQPRPGVPVVRFDQLPAVDAQRRRRPRLVYSAACPSDPRLLKESR